MKKRLVSMLDFKAAYGNAKTQSTVTSHIVRFLDFIYGKPIPRGQLGIRSDDRMKAYDKLSLDYLMDTERDHFEDATLFVASMCGTVSPLSARSSFVFLKQWFGYNDIEFSDHKKKMIKNKLPKGGSQTVERKFSVETIRNLLENADLRMKTLVCFMSSTGCRIDETLHLEIKDLEFDGEDVCTITLPGEITKGGKPRICFCSTESVRLLKLWLFKQVTVNKINSETNREEKILTYTEAGSEREKYMIASANRGKGLKVTRPEIKGDRRVFPFSSQTVLTAWRGLSDKSGLGEVCSATGRRTWHPHMLRKFFRSVLGLKCPVDLVEKMMGHSGYLTKEYVVEMDGELTPKDYYRKHSNCLHIFGDKDLSDLREQMAETVKTLEETKEVQTKTGVALTSVVIENTGLKTELTTMKDQMGTMAIAIKDMQDLMVMVAGLPKEKRDALAKVEALSQ